MKPNSTVQVLVAHARAHGVRLHELKAAVEEEWLRQNPPPERPIQPSRSPTRGEDLRARMDSFSERVRWNTESLRAITDPADWSRYESTYASETLTGKGTTRVEAFVMALGRKRAADLFTEAGIDAEDPWL